MASMHVFSMATTFVGNKMGPSERVYPIIHVPVLARSESKHSKLLNIKIIFVTKELDNGKKQKNFCYL